nr:reverse transcriptase domain-containing protein [Tanacetum cinerariifolium]
MPLKSAPLTQAAIRRMIKDNVDAAIATDECAEGKKVRFAAATLQGPALTWWNSKTTTMGLETMNRMPWTEMKQLITTEFYPIEERFNELALMCPRMVKPERVKKSQAKDERILEGKMRKWESFQSGNSSGKGNQRDNSRQTLQNNQRQGNARAMVTTPTDGRLLLSRGSWKVRGRAYAIKDAKPKGSNVVTGTFLLDNRYAFVLFDSGSDRSFVDTRFSSMLDIDPVKIGASYEVELAYGRVFSTNIVLKGCTLNLVNHVFEIDLMLIELGTFDVIIGMDWFVKHDVIIIYGERVVRLPYGNKMLIVESNKGVSRLKVISCIKARLPPPRQVEFRIDLVSRVAPIARAPYRLAVSEMKELSDEEEHKKHLKIILVMLKKERLYAKFSKCDFWLDSVLFLGHVLDRSGVHVDHAKVEAIKSWVALTMLMKVRRFLRLVGHYRRFIESLPEGTEDFVVYCDAYLNGYGSVLMQREKIIAFFGTPFHEGSSCSSINSITMSQSQTVIEDDQTKRWHDVSRNEEIYTKEGRHRDKPLEFKVGDMVLLKVSPWKGVVCFGKCEKLSPRYIGPFKILAKVGPLAYTLDLPEELKGIHSTFHVSNLNKCLAEGDVVIPLDEIQLDDKLHMIEERVKVVDREVKQLRQSQIPIVKVRWNSQRGPKYTWEHEDQIKKKSRANPTLLNDFEMAAEGPGDLPVPDLQTMEELCQPSLNDWGGPIAPIAIQATNFGLKNDMIQQSIKVNGVTDDALRLYLFPHSLTHHATAWFDRLPRNSINTFEQMAKMFLGKYFPPSMVTKLRNEITNFRQRLDESLFEAWEHYKLLIDRCPNHNMLPVTQIDTLYNGLTLRHRDTINAAAGGTIMKRRPEECYDLIENMTAHHNDWDTSAQRSESSSSITSSSDTKIVALKAEMAKINKNLMRVLQVNQQVKAVTPNCETCGGPHSFNDCPATVGNTQNVYAAGAYQGNTLTNPEEHLKGITTRSGTTYQGPTIPTSSSSLLSVVERKTEETKDTVHPTNNESTKDVQPPIIHTESPILNFEPIVALIIEPVASPVKFGPSIKSLFTNKDKLFELARTLLNEHFSAVLLKKLPEKLGDPGKFLIRCDFPGMAECLALADLDASINLMPLSVWNKLSLPELTPTLTTLELVYRSISRPIGVAKDVYVKVGTFHFLANFVIVDFDADPRVPLILGRSFLNTERALIDVFEANYKDMTANRIDVIDMACEEYSQEVFGFSDVIASSNPTPYYDPIVSTTSLTLSPFRNSDFLLNEVDAFLALEDDPTLSKVDQYYVDTEGDVLLLEAFLNDDPSLPPPNQRNYMPQVRKELKICGAKSNKSSIDEPPEVELRTYLPILNTHFWKVTICC